MPKGPYGEGTCQYDKCKKKFAKNAPGQKYCSDPAKCKTLAYNESRRKDFGTTECRFCGKEFKKSKTIQYYCPRPATCKADYENARARVSTVKPCRRCQKDFTVDIDHKVYCPACTDELGPEVAANPRPLTPDELVKQKELAKIESKVRDDVGRTRILAEMLDESVQRVNEKDIKPYKVIRRTKRDPETMVVLRSDFHPGIVTPSYNLDKFHERMELFIEKIVLVRDIISETIPLEKIVVINLGDLVSGQGIFPNMSWKSQTHVLNQIYHEAVPDLIAQDLTLCEYFPVVQDEYVPGNHGRTGKEYPDEVNFDNVLSRDIWRRFEFVDQVDVRYVWGHFKFVDIYGWRFLCTHGDLVRAWMNIPFYGLVNKGMRWKGSMSPSRKDVGKAIAQTIKDSSLTDAEKVAAIQHITSTWHYMVHGHFHTPFAFPWNDFEIIGNGTLVSDDDFGLEQLGMASTPAQQVFGVHPEHGVTWRYTLDLAA